MIKVRSTRGKEESPGDVNTGQSVVRNHREISFSPENERRGRSEVLAASLSPAL